MISGAAPMARKRSKDLTFARTTQHTYLGNIAQTQWVQAEAVHPLISCGYPANSRARSVSA